MGERLQVGDLNAVLVDGPELRDIRFLHHVILDGIALTVRAPDWSTVRGGQLNRTITASDQGVRVTQGWRFHLSPGTVRCHLVIELEEMGVSIALETEVESATQVNRAGLVFLHPLELVGRRVTLLTTSGPREDEFPIRVNPHQPFTDLRGMVYPVADGVTAVLDFGDALYETEDHRNWCDAGWKSYTPPLAQAVPLRLDRGERRHQRVRISVSSNVSTPQHQRVEPLSVRLHPMVQGFLPALGWGAGPLPAHGVASLPYGPSFLAVEVLADAAGRERLRSALAQVESRQLPLRVTVAASESQVPAIAKELGRLASQISHVCFVDPVTHVSHDALVRAAAAELSGTSIVLGAGTRGYLAELGRSATGFQHAQFAQLSISAEVHHDDDERVIDTTRALPFVLESARAIAGGLPIVVSPLTLAQRFSMHRPADHRYAPWDPAVEPDRRTAEALGVAWCLASVAGLVGADALCYFSVAPGHGLLDAVARPTPVAQLLAELSSHAGRPVLRCEVSDPHQLGALALLHQDAVTLYLANLAADHVEVVVKTSLTSVPVLLNPYEVRRLLTGRPSSGT